MQLLRQDLDHILLGYKTHGYQGLAELGAAYLLLLQGSHQLLVGELAFLNQQVTEADSLSLHCRHDCFPPSVSACESIYSSI